MALDKPLWGLLAASRATHWWCMPNNDDDDDVNIYTYTMTDEAVNAQPEPPPCLRCQVPL